MKNIMLVKQYQIIVGFLSYIYEQESDSLDMICKKLPLRNQPRIASYHVDTKTEYFIICEQKVL